MVSCMYRSGFNSNGMYLYIYTAYINGGTGVIFLDYYSAYYHQQYHPIQLHLFENYRHMKDGTPG